MSINVTKYMDDTTKCSNQNCQLRERCLRHTQKPVPNQKYTFFKTKRAGNKHVCNEYRYNGQTFIE